MSTLRTAMLLALMTALFLGVGYLLAGEGGALVALVVAAGMNVFAWWNSDKIVLKMYKARQVDRDEAPELERAVRRLSSRAGLPMPKLYLVDNDQPNAFATGRNPENAAVAVTTGLMKALNHDELDGVIAHELAHIKNRDTLTMTLTATIAGAISMIAHWALFFGRGRNSPLGIFGVLAVMILAPIAAMLVQMAVSRTREYSADKTGAGITGKPLALATALRRLRNTANRVDNPTAEEYPATAHLFIVNPLHGGRMDNLFSTHPNMDNRVARLEAMAGGVMGGAMRGLEGKSESPIRYSRRRPDRPRQPQGPIRRRRGPWG